MALNLDAIGQKIGPLSKDYDWKDVVLYALGVGAGFDELDYVYEGRLKVIPSFAIASIFEFLAETAVAANVDLSGILHGEQDIIFHNPIPTQGTLTTEGRVTHIYDKGADKGALIISQADTYHSDGQKLYTNIFTLFCRKDGGFGGEPGPSLAVDIPNREPDFVEDALPSEDQPLIYRLSGDIFTLHVDPDFAKASGFEKPIMHGLCTHGFACRAVIKHLMPGHPERMTRFRVRFSKTIYPGVPIQTQIWTMDDGTAYFRTINAENGDTVLDGGIVQWLSAEEARKRQRRGALVTGAGASTSAADAVVAEIKEAGGSSGSASGGVAAVFERMPQAFQAEAAAGVEVVFQYDISGAGGGQWYCVVAGGACQVSEGVHEAPTTTIKMNHTDFLALTAGELNPMTAFTSGKLKIEGDLMKSQLIDKLFKF